MAFDPFLFAALGCTVTLLRRSTGGRRQERQRATERETMRILVKGKNLAVSDNIRNETIDKLSKIRQIYDRILDIEVVFSEDHNPRIVEKVHCEVTFRVKGKTMRASAAAPDPHTALDRVQAKAICQVRRYKNKMIDSHRQERAHATA
jgi:ribosomal subunit interface protein